MESKQIISQSPVTTTATVQVILPGQVWQVLQEEQQQTLVRVLISIGQELVTSQPTTAEVADE